MSKSQLKYNIINDLINGAAPKDIAKEHDVAYPTVLRYKREFEAAKLEGNVDQLLDIDDVVLSEVMATVEAQAPEVLREGVNGAVAELASGLQGLERLQTEFQTTASYLNTRIRSLAMSVEHISELNVLTDSLCALQSAFFNKNATQVNIQNNYDESGNKYANFLSDKVAD
jgi:hypothetical protein